MRFDFSSIPLRPQAFSKRPMTFCDPEPKNALSAILDPHHASQNVTGVLAGGIQANKDLQSQYDQKYADQTYGWNQQIAGVEKMQALEEAARQHAQQMEDRRRAAADKLDQDHQQNLNRAQDRAEEE